MGAAQDDMGAAQDDMGAAQDDMDLLSAHQQLRTGNN
jgi:hypothetical protein